MNSAIRARREAEDGFTLIELLVVVIIIGILAAIAIPAFLNQRERAWQAELTSAVRNGALDVEAEATANGGAYPSTDAGLQAVIDFVDANISDADAATSTHATAVDDSPILLIDYQALQTDGTATGASTEAGAGFSLCMEHDLINDTNNSVVYLGGSGGSGLQGFQSVDCAANTDHV